MAEATKAKGRGERIVMLVGAAALAVLGWLAGRHLGDAPALPWILWAAALASLVFGLFAPLRWLRFWLGLNLFTQDMFKR